jgi:hypothetical protein
MKTKYLIALLLICNQMFAQKDHNFLVGGGIGYRYSDDDSGITKSNFIQKQEHLLQLDPTFGYFFSKNIVAGLAVEYFYDNINYDNYSYYKAVENDLSIAPFLRYYTRFGLFFHAEFDYGISKLTFKGRPLPAQTGFIDLSESYNFKITLLLRLDLYSQNMVGISEASRNMFSLYPSPATSQFTVQMPVAGNYSVTVSDVQGKSVYFSELKNDTRQSVSTEKWANGVYIVKVSSEGKNYFGKVVVAN